MYLIKRNNIKLTRGDTLIAQVGIIRDDEPYTPEDGDEIRFAMKHPTMNSAKTEYTDKEPLLTKNIPIDTLILQLDPEDTKSFGFGEYVYDLEITFADGYRDTFVSATITLTPEVD